jgi:hypothetical protein
LRNTWPTGLQFRVERDQLSGFALRALVLEPQPHALFPACCALAFAKRNGAWEARKLFGLIKAVERDLATAAGHERPACHAPRPKR